MSIFLQHPALLPLLALAGLPLLVHLLSRARPPEYRFSNTEFLRRVIRRTARFRRPKDWLLLALRTLALAALAAAFISPLIVSNNAALPGESSTVVLLIDRSASMAAREGAGSRFESACAQAARFLDDARPDFANIVWIDSEPAPAFPEPGPNLGFLTEQLNTTKPKPESGALAAAFDLAIRQITQARGHAELILISDFQASAWRDFQPDLPQDLNLRSHRIATGAPPNLAVTRLLSQPADPVAGQEITLLASVRNFSPDAVRTRLTLDADGALQSQPVDLPAWGETETALPLRPAKSGPLAITASIEPDTFPGDDARHTVVRVRDTLRIATPDADAAHPLRKLAASLPWLEAAATPGPGDILALTRWSDPAAPRKHAESGVTVLIHDAFDSDPSQILTGPPPALADGGSWNILPAESHPAVELFRSGEFGNPFAGTFRKRLKLTPANLPESSRLIASYDDAVPAIIEIPTDGAPMIFFNLSLDPERTDWPAQSAFLPAIAEILLRTRPRSAADTGQFPAGSHLSHHGSDPSLTTSVTLVGPAGTQLATTLSTTPDGSVRQSDLPAAPGIHHWQVSGQTIDSAAVNFPESESDLRPLDAAPSFDGSAASADSLARQAALSRGVPLWPWLALAALVFLLAESLVHLLSPRPATP